jgi:ribosome-associated protein
MWIECRHDTADRPGVRIEIPDSEIGFETSTSGGPGGQHANRVETRVTVVFDVASSGAFSSGQRDQLLSRLGRRLSRDGWLWIDSDRYRSQRMNRDDALGKFRNAICRALEPERVRKTTRVPGAAKARRLDEKKRRSEIKKSRKPGDED